MRKARWFLLGLILILLACGGSGYVGWYMGIRSLAISRHAATEIAIEHAGNGIVRNARLDRSKGKPVWEINILQPSGKKMTEVRVHALTAEVLAVRYESVQKANKELAEVVKHLGVTAEQLQPKSVIQANASPSSSEDTSIDRSLDSVTK